MLIYSSQKIDGSHHWILLFGLGQIGTAIKSCLENLQFQLVYECPFSWKDKSLRVQESSLVRTYIEERVTSSDSISVVWSAGVCGFHSTKSQVDIEFDIFRDVLCLTTTLNQSIYPSELDFHLISSAGGLFEGQRFVGPDSTPSPLRWYGKLKLAQENAAKAVLENHSLCVYRPSSVYGPMLHSTDRGLINNLISNARSGRTTVLDSKLMSLRDYVYAGDIGNYIGRKIKNQTKPQSTLHHFLVSSRCSSIFEVVQKIRKILNLNVYYTLDDNFGNNRNITFNQNVMPVDWQPATLSFGIRQFALVNLDAWIEKERL